MRRTSRLSIGIVCALAATLLFASVAYGAPVKKMYTVDISAVSPPVTAGQPETFNVTIANKTATQSLGSCNLTLPASLTDVSVTQPAPAPGIATLDGNVIQLRELATPPMGSKSFTFTATSPTAGNYTASADCRQANNYSPSTPSNTFTLDANNSTLSWTALSPVPNVDLSIVTSAEEFDPVAGGNTVRYLLTVTNNSATTSANASVSDTVSGAGSLTSIEGAGWNCSGSGNTRTCTRSLAPGQSSVLDVRALANVVSSTTTMTNAATVSHVSGANDDVPGNDSTSETTTVTAGSSNGSGFIDNITGGVVITEPFATPANRFVGRIVFPGQDGGTPGGFRYTMNQDTDTCTVLPCTFAMFIQDIPAAYDNPLTEGVRFTIKCDASVCTGKGTAITMFVRDETGQQKIVLGCNFLGIVDPNPCVERTERLVGGQDNGDLSVTMLFLAGDPKVAGLCVGSC